MNGASETRSPGDQLTSLHITKAITNDRESVAWLVSRFTPLLLCQAHQRIAPALRRHCDPDDVVADVWMVLLRSLPSLVAADGSMTKGLLRFATTVLIRRVRDLFEKNLVNKPPMQSLSAEDQDLLVPADTRDVVSHVMAGELKGAVWAALNALPRDDREVLVLHGIEGRPHKEVGARIGLTPEHSAVRYHRAIKRLREQIPVSVFDDLVEVEG
jgi:RNA polymerase sigma factor (sigma-70 family)